MVEYIAGNTANETPSWISGPPVESIHDYQFTFPAPFTAEAGIKYWVQIEGIQPGPTDWGLVGGGSGGGVLVYATAGVGDFVYFRVAGDVAYTLTGLVGTPPIIYTHWVYLPLLLK